MSENQLFEIDGEKLVKCRKDAYGSITIPNGITTIGYRAFNDCNNIISIEIPESLIEIDNLFLYSDELKNVQNIKVNNNNKNYQSIDGVLFDKDKKRLIKVPPAYGQSVYSVPTGIIEICSRAFNDCNGLTNINIPQSVELINCLFDGKNLQKISVAEENNHFSSVDGVLFNKEKTKLIRIPQSFPCTQYTIPDEVIEIEYHALWCDKITSINIPDRVRILHTQFDSNTNLREINVGERNTTYSSLDGVLFNKNRSKLIRFPSAHKLTNYTIPDGVVEIGKNAFARCDNIVSVKIPEGVMSIDAGTFKHLKSLNDINLPSSIREIKGNIMYGAFSGCSSLKNINIPEGVTRIGEKAFYDCSSLEEIELPKSLIEIERSAFSGCSSLTHLSIPENVIRIGREKPNLDGDICKCAWNRCPSLKEITVDKNNPSFCVEDGALYTKDKTCIIKVINPSDKEHFKILDGVTEINLCAFRGLESLKSVDIPEGVVKIGRYAFRDCPNLTSIKIPFSVTNIGNDAFGEHCVVTIANCSMIYKGVGVTQLIIQDSVKEIGDHAFCNCHSLKSIELPDSITRVGFQSFAYCDKLQEMEIPISVKEIDSFAFQDCKMLDCIAIPKNVSKIESSAFKGCSGLNKIAVSKSNLYYCSIDGVLFSKDGTTLLRYPIAKSGDSYTIPVGVKVIDKLAFEGCVNLRSITIPEGVVEIRSEAFRGCENLNGILIPESVQVLGLSIVGECNRITAIRVPKEVQRLSFAFDDCACLARIEVDEENTYFCSEKGVLFNKDKTALIRFPQSHKDDAYTIPISVNEVKSSAFKGCTKLASIDIHNNVTNIEVGAFQKCRNLKMLKIPRGVSTICSQLVRNCDKLEEIKMHEEITLIGNLAFEKCKSLKSIELPDSINHIEWSSFTGCTGLTKIYSRLENIDFIDERTFKDVDKKKCMLFVPIGTKYTYKHHPAFKDFENIITEVELD